MADLHLIIEPLIWECQGGLNLQRAPGTIPALAYAIHNQRNRRNLTEAELLRCIDAVDRVKEVKIDESGKFTVGPDEPTGKSADQTAAIVGTSATKVKKAWKVRKENRELSHFIDFSPQNRPPEKPVERRFHPDPALTITPFSQPYPSR